MLSPRAITTLMFWEVSEDDDQRTTDPGTELAHVVRGRNGREAGRAAIPDGNEVLGEIVIIVSAILAVGCVCQSRVERPNSRRKPQQSRNQQDDDGHSVVLYKWLHTKRWDRSGGNEAQDHEEHG